MDVAGYHLFLKAEPDVTDIYSISREKFDALTLAPGDFSLSSSDFEGANSVEKFEIAKNAGDFSIDFKIKFSKRPETNSYKLDVQFKGITVPRTETKRIPTGPSESIPILSSDKISYLDGSAYYGSDMDLVLTMQKMEAEIEQIQSKEVMGLQ